MPRTPQMMFGTSPTAEAPAEPAASDVAADDAADMMLMCGECCEEPEPEGAAAPSTADAAENRFCFDCDATLAVLAETSQWVSLTYGTMLCPSCASEHRELSSDRASSVHQLSDLHEHVVHEALARGGNAKMRAFLEGESIGVSAAVWRALPIQLRYCTPAADLYRRRQEAEASGTEELPTELVRQPLPAPAKRQRLAHTPVVAGITGVDMMGSRSCWSWRGLW